MKLVLSRLPLRMVNMVNYFEDEDKEKFLLITEKEYKNEYYNLNVNVRGYKDYINNPDIIKDVIELNKRYKFTKIVALEEVDVDKASILAEILGLDCTNIVEGKSFRNKYIMKKLLYGINDIYIPKVNKFSEIDKVKEFPVVLKNDSLYSGREVYLVKNELDFKTIEKVLNVKSNYIAEEYIRIPNMISVDGYMFKNEIHHMYIHDYSQSILDYMNDKSNPLFITSTSYLNDDINQYSRIRSITQDILDRLCYGGSNEFKAFHLELFHDRENNKYVFCEIGQRFGGGKITELVEHAFDIDMTKQMYDFEIKGIEPLKQLLRESHKYSAGVRLPKRVGRIIKMPNFNRVKGVISTEFRFKEGDVLGNINFSNDYMCTVLICADTLKDLKNKIEELNEIFERELIMEQLYD